MAVSRHAGGGQDNRRARVQAAVAEGLGRWHGNMAADAGGAESRRVAERIRVGTNGADMTGQAAHVGAEPMPVATPARTREDVIGPLPRRQQLLSPSGTRLQSPDLAPLTFDVGRLACLRRLFVWVGVAARLAFELVRHNAVGDGSQEGRARLVRESLERVGGTFVKFGQQIAMRIDLVPWAYCVEFSKMLDRMAPFSLDAALAAVESAIGRPWQEVFAVFDPEPIGAASIGCVYQARLHDGRMVAVKVRRPGIGELLAADLQVIDWLGTAVEALTLVRPGFTRNLRRELRETLLEELDFRREAQYQHTFRHNARRQAKRSFFTAPRVYFEYSNDRVLVQEHVTGMWLTEVIAAVESGDPDGHRMMAQLKIDPHLVGRRILWAAFWSMDEHLFFHADPHPANLLVGADSRITFVDFGSCGSFNEDQRAASERLGTCMQRDDVEGMTRATLKLLEPLPPVDVSVLMRQIQREYAQTLTTFRTKSKHTEWWERSSAQLWMAMLRICREHNLPIGLGTLRMIRASLLYDSIVLRLDPHISRFDEYEKFRGDRARFARDRWRRRIRDARSQLLLQAGTWAETGDELLERAQHALSIPTAGFGALVQKSVFAVTTMVRILGRAAMLGILATVVMARWRMAGAGTFDLFSAGLTVLRSALYQGTVGALVVFGLRQVLFRLREHDVRSAS